jgi:hypothetical protein
MAAEDLMLCLTLKQIATSLKVRGPYRRVFKPDLEPTLHRSISFGNFSTLLDIR